MYSFYLKAATVVLMTVRYLLIAMRFGVHGHWLWASLTVGLAASCGFTGWLVVRPNQSNHGQASNCED